MHCKHENAGEGTKIIRKFMVNKKPYSKRSSIFAALQDDISRELFDLRLEAHISGGIDFSGCIKSTVEQKKIDASQGLVLYGAGHLSGFVLHHAKADGFDITCFCDSDPEKWGAECHGLPVISPSRLMEDYSEHALLISTNYGYDEINNGLAALGFPMRQVIDWNWPTSKWPRSQNEHNQYFNETDTFLRPVKDEVFVDAGAYIGDTIERFLKFCGGGYKTIYAIEPNAQNFEKLKITTSEYANIVLINKGVWSSATTLQFNDGSTWGASIEKNGSSSIETITIDELTANDVVTLIKMDVEGSELQALKGAAETIKRNKPRLAICIYNKLDDILTIPGYILSLVPEYKLYIRHYSQIASETVLYAVM